MTGARAGGAVVRAAFVPLLDAAPLVVARAKGFAAAEGVDLRLSREPSWAAARDRLAAGRVEAAHLLAPLAIACNLGLLPQGTPLLAPFSMGLGGNAVAVSAALWAEVERLGASDLAPDLAPGPAGRAIAAVARARGAPLRFGVVHRYSSHAYELLYWLAASGLDPARHLALEVVPPPRMPEALAAGDLDGFCAGEPWGSAAVALGAGRLATVKALIWRRGPEKVLAVHAGWAGAEPLLLDALLRALQRAAEWCGEPAHHGELVGLLAAPEHVGCPPEWLWPALSGELDAGGGAPAVRVPDAYVPAAGAATFPWRSHALWFYGQMVRWGQIAPSAEAAAAARATYRPDLLRRALGPLGTALPEADDKVEGALDRPTPVGPRGLILGPDGFFDGERFDPDALGPYLARQAGSQTAT